jgi:F-type H+-transporting ATPase subunit alpha
LKQNEGSPLSVEHQIAVLYVGTKGLIGNVPVNKVKQFEEEYIAYLEAKHRDTLDLLQAGKYTDAATDVLTAVAAELSAKY